MNEENKYGVWGKFFHSGFSQERYNSLSADANNRATSFMESVRKRDIIIADDLTTHSQYAFLDQWVSENDELLTRLVVDIQRHILSVVQFSLPAHDERQILFKDASEGLRFYQMEKPEGYKSTFVIPMFAHDIGRLLEGRMYAPEQNPHENWVAHSKFSFMMLQELLQQPQYDSIPEALKNHYLYAVLSHSGNNGESYMSRAVQTCDRQQLYGAEGLFRALSYGTCLMRAEIKYPDDLSYETTLPDMFDHRSVISILEYCSRNMRENIGEQHAKWQRRIAVENIVLLMAYCDGNEELKRRIFAPELDPSREYGSKKRIIHADLLEEAYNQYEANKLTEDVKLSFHQAARATSDHQVLISTALKAIEGPIGAIHVTDSMRDYLDRAIKEMSQIERESLFHMMMVATKLRLEQDEIDLKVCKEMETVPQQFIRAIAVAARKYRDVTPDVSTTPACSPAGISAGIMSLQPF